MLLRTLLCLRRPRGRYVLKYLEGVPTSQKLINHLAGTGISGQTSSIDLYTTVPRYIHKAHEQRLSQLFFHHVLYPPGGARMPYQPIIIRGGRGVCQSKIFRLQRNCRTEVVTAHKRRPAATLSTAHSSFSAPRGVHVLTVPACHAVSSPASCSSPSLLYKQVQQSASAQMPCLSSEDAGSHRESNLNSAKSMSNDDSRDSSNCAGNNDSDHTICVGENNSSSNSSSSTMTKGNYYYCEVNEGGVDGGVSLAQWARVDPARRPFFYAPRQSHDGTDTHVSQRTGQYSMATPRAHVWHTGPPQHSLLPSTSSNCTLHPSGAASPCRLVTTKRAERNMSGVVTEAANGPPISAQRPVTDSVFEALCGVIQCAFTAPHGGQACRNKASRQDDDDVQPRNVAESDNNKNDDDDDDDNSNALYDGVSIDGASRAVLRGLGQLRVNTSRIQPSSTQSGKISSSSSSASVHDMVQRCLRVCRTVATAVHNQAKSRNHVNAHTYLYTHLPASCIARLTRRRTQAQLPGAVKQEERDCVTLFRLAGGVEPRVSFAVGVPRHVRVKASDAKTDYDHKKKQGHDGVTVKHVESSFSFEDVDAIPPPFTHITCLTRISLHMCNAHHTSSSSSSSSSDPNSSANACTSNDAYSRDGNLGQSCNEVSHEGMCDAGRAVSKRVADSAINVAAEATVAPLLSAHQPPRRHGLSRQVLSDRPYDVTTEPWMLGHALDPLVPLRARTVSESPYTPMHKRTPCTTTSSTVGHESSSNNSTSSDDGKKHDCLVDGHVANELDDCVLFDHDAETYLLPQRELLLRLYVPAHVEQMCAEQNRRRVGTPTSSSYHTAQRLTAAHMAEEQLRNLTSASSLDANATHATALERHGACVHQGIDPDGTGTHAQAIHGSYTAHKEQHPRNHVSAGQTRWRHYEVRALPGDVIYIPRDWGVEVRRVTGTAFIQQVWPSTTASASSAAAADATRGTMGVHFVHSSSSDATVSRYREYLAHSNGGQRRGDVGVGAPTGPVCAHAQADQRRTQPEAHPTTSKIESGDGKAAMSVTHVEVDALCLRYEAYPVLSDEQVRTYVAANYCHRGIDEFYRNGGNTPFCKYV